VPFVQGRLDKAYISATIDTTCGHCGREMRIAVDSDMNAEVQSKGADPLVFMPDVDWQAFSEPNIIGTY